MHRVLVIGERPDEAKALCFRLGLLGWEAAPSAADLTLALRSLFAFKPDIIVLDAVMASAAQELFELLGSVSELPIVVLGDGRQADELVWYLDHGAADYLAKPLNPSMLAARLGAIIRRTTTVVPAGVLRAGRLEIDLDRHLVRKDGRAVSLTPTEFRLLHFLAENAGRACNHRMLLERVWGEDFRHCSHYLRLYIGYLRQKLEDDPRSPRLLVTEWGVGYRLLAEGQPGAAPALRSRRVALA